MVGEEWRAVPGFPGYEVSSLGRVRSWRDFHGGTSSVPRILTLRADARGKNGATKAMSATLFNGGKAYAVSVHKLVLEAFVSPRPCGHEGSHLDGNPSNNHVSNLMWETHRDNERRKGAHGTKLLGSKHPQAILTEKVVAEIRRLFAEGEMTKTELARSFGTNRRNIYFILSRKTWAHVLAA